MFTTAMRIVIISSLLIGCAVVPPETKFAADIAAPERWAAIESGAAAPPPVGDWLASFDDAVLSALVREAIANNRDLGAAYARLEASRRSAKAARATLLPTLDANFNFSRNAIVVNPTTAAQAGGGGGGGASRLFINNFQAGGQVSWEPDSWGRLRDNAKSAYVDAFTQEADAAASELSVAAQVAQSWFGFIEAGLQRRLAERDIVARARSLRVTERRYARGVAESADVRLARSALASSEATHAARMQAEKEAVRALEVLLGRYPAAETKAADSLPVLEDLAGPGAPGDILARRPDLIAAELRLMSAGLRARAARKELLPQITFTVQANTSGPFISDLIDPERIAGALATGLAQPLFQGGRLRANAKAERARAEAAIYDYAQAVLNAYQEAENAIGAERLLKDQETALKVAFEESAAAQEITERRYAAGAASIFNVLDAQTRRISSESQYINIAQQRLSNRVRLYLAIGGDFLTDIDVRTFDDPKIFRKETDEPLKRKRINASGSPLAGKAGADAG
ncbi:MAG: efflux transporter outer membrane subunit [Pseudomonadota bacterium]